MRADADADYSIYGLLYVDKTHNRHANLRPRRADPIDIYLKCAALCARSVAAHRHRFRLVTNDAGALRQRAAALNVDAIEIVEQTFTRSVPPCIPFYAAHFKLDLLAAFGTGAYGSHLGLVDIDTVLRRPLALPLLPRGGLAAYDISYHVFPEYGADRVRVDLERVAGEPFETVRWYGGEFLFSDSAGFRDLSDIIAQCWPRYINAVADLHHVGDEMIVSAALNIAAKRGISVCDAGASGAIIRWWSARTAFKQRPLSHIRNHSFIHLPSDKPFLSRYAAHPFQEDAFITAYRRYVRGKLIARHLYTLSMQVRGRPKKFVGRLED